MTEFKLLPLKRLHIGYQRISLYIYFLSLALIASGLLFSRAMISIGFISFMANWILEGNYSDKWHTLKSNRAGMIISAIFFIHLIGMLNTQNISYGMGELRVKLPLLLPLFYGSSKKLIKAIKPDYFLYLFIAAALFASIISFLKFEYTYDYQTVEDLNRMALVGENIQLSLFINLSIFSSLYFLIKQIHLSFFIKLLLLLNAIWQIIYLYLLNSLTGYISFIILLIFSALFVLKYKKRMLFLLGVIIFSIGFLLTLYLQNEINKFDQEQKIDFKNLPKYTINGNEYFHDTVGKRTENGYYIDIYVCREELKKEWEKVSNLDFTGSDRKGQNLSETLIRYLSSKGLSKDSVGFHSLAAKDISFIENGCANFKYTNKFSLESRIYNILWQLNKYNKTGNATAQSVSQRIEFLKASLKIIKENFWFGVGTGDVMDEFNQTLEKTGSLLEKKYRNRVHNQYIVAFTALGFFGFIIFLFITFYPFFKFKMWGNYLFITFYLIILISYFTDNTLETQMGVSFFSFFYCLFCFSKSEK